MKYCVVDSYDNEIIYVGTEKECEKFINQQTYNKEHILYTEQYHTELF